MQEINFIECKRRKHGCTDLASASELDSRGCTVRPWTQLYSVDDYLFIYFSNAARFGLKQFKIGLNLV